MTFLQQAQAISDELFIGQEHAQLTIGSLDDGGPEKEKMTAMEKYFAELGLKDTSLNKEIAFSLL